MDVGMYKSDFCILVLELLYLRFCALFRYLFLFLNGVFYELFHGFGLSLTGMTKTLAWSL